MRRVVKDFGFYWTWDGKLLKDSNRVTHLTCNCFILAAVENTVEKTRKAGWSDGRLFQQAEGKLVVTQTVR